MMGIPIRLPAWITGLIMAGMLAGVLAGCGKPAMSGLQPRYPPVEKKWYALLAEFVEVDSLTPTFRWQPLDRDMVKASMPHAWAPLHKVTYEIRIWRTVSGNPGKLVYERRHLITPEHRLERSLDPGTRYYWSVRAHFETNGGHRITEWALAGYLLRSETVPNDACLRFKTPLKAIIE